MIPLDRGSSHLTSRCSTIFHPLPTSPAWPLCQLHQAFQFPPFSSPIGLVSEAVNTVVKLVRKTMSLVVQYEVNPQLLRAQSQACWGAGVTFPGLAAGGGEQGPDN